MRRAIDRAANKAGHRYRHDSLTDTFICADCGTCERRSGVFWWAGKWSAEEPPCTGAGEAKQWAWHERANLDLEPDAVRLKDAVT